jgi:hypothetical protein
MTEKMKQAIQDEYPEDFAWCYGCGRLNKEGHQFRTGWQGEETVTVYTPKPEHTAIPGFVYGGLIASLVDCHGTGSAKTALNREAGKRRRVLSPLLYMLIIRNRRRKEKP